LLDYFNSRIKKPRGNCGLSREVIQCKKAFSCLNLVIIMDKVSKEKRSRIMSAVHNKNTGAELIVRKYLWAHGIRYRIHLSNLPGKPDIVIPSCKLVIFVHGCFWHGHENCSRGRLPKSRIKYWKSKITANKKRDLKTSKLLKSMGWRELVIWDCQLRTQRSTATTLPSILISIQTICAEFVQGSKEEKTK
jgi:DNA mismatch endonuclease (patch repair protein)